MTRRRDKNKAGEWCAEIASKLGQADIFSAEHATLQRVKGPTHTQPDLALPLLRGRALQRVASSRKVACRYGYRPSTPILPHARPLALVWMLHVGYNQSWGADPASCGRELCGPPVPCACRQAILALQCSLWELLEPDTLHPNMPCGSENTRHRDIGFPRG